MEQERGYCSRCDEYVLRVRSGPNHLLHFVLTLLTAGLWIPIWILSSIQIGGWKCPRCGGAAGRAYDLEGILHSRIGGCGVLGLFLVGLCVFSSGECSKNGTVPPSPRRQPTPMRANKPNAKKLKTSTAPIRTYITMVNPEGSAALLASPYNRSQSDFDCSPRIPHGVRLVVLDKVSVSMSRWENDAIREVDYPLYKVSYKGNTGWVGKAFVDVSHEQEDFYEKPKETKISKTYSFKLTWKELSDRLMCDYQDSILSIEQLNSITCWVILIPYASDDTALKIAEAVGNDIKKCKDKCPSIHIFIGGKHRVIARVPSRNACYHAKIQIKDWNPSAFNGKYKPK